MNKLVSQYYGADYGLTIDKGYVYGAKIDLVISLRILSADEY